MGEPTTNNSYAVPNGERMGRIAGYRKMSEQELQIFEEIKQAEERTLRYVDGLRQFPDFDGRWISIAVTHFQQGTMALLRAVARPQRIALPEDAGGEAVRPAQETDALSGATPLMTDPSPPDVVVDDGDVVDAETGDAVLHRDHPG